MILNRLLTFVPLLAFGTAAMAQATRNGVWELDIRAAEERERTAVLGRDIAVLQKILADGYVVNSAHHTILHKGDALEDIHQGKTAMSSYRQSIESIRRFGDIVIVTGGETVAYIAPSPQAGQTLHQRFTDVWHLENDGWRLIAGQSEISGADYDVE